jgi:endonuclease/exonuclease/phosphatase family metal-dependent hydrolase
MSRLIQLNVWGGRLENTLKDFLSAQKPDIICLQEAISYKKPNPAFFYSIENMQKLCDLPYLAFGPVFTFNLMRGSAGFGNCIISRFPIQKTEIVFTRLEHNEDFDFNEDDYNARNFIHGQIDINGKMVHVLTHHGFHVPEHKEGTNETLAQMQHLRDYVASLEGPIILTGDFNLVPHSKSLELINSQLQNLSISHNLKTTRNAFTYKREVCDYIFVNDEIHTERFSVSEELVSDHKALILEFTI